MEQDRPQLAAIKPMARSKITNGRRMLDGIDGRSAVAMVEPPGLSQLMLGVDVPSPYAP